MLILNAVGLQIRPSGLDPDPALGCMKKVLKKQQNCNVIGIFTIFAA